MFIASALVHTSHQTVPLCEHHCSCFVVQSTQQNRSLFGHYLLRNLCSALLFPSPAPDSGRCRRRQDQALQSVILQSAALVVASCNELEINNSDTRLIAVAGAGFKYPLNLGSDCISMIFVNLAFYKISTMRFCHFLQKLPRFGL